MSKRTTKTEVALGPCESGASSQCWVVGLGCPKPGAGCRTTEEVLQQCPHTCSQSQAGQASELGPQGGRRGRGAGSREAWALVHYSLGSAGEGKPEAFVSHRPSTYCIHTSEMLGDPSLCSRELWSSKEI